MKHQWSAQGEYFQIRDDKRYGISRCAYGSDKVQYLLWRYDAPPVMVQIVRQVDAVDVAARKAAVKQLRELADGEVCENGEANVSDAG